MGKRVYMPGGAGSWSSFRHQGCKLWRDPQWSKREHRQAVEVKMLGYRGHFCPQGASVQVMLGWRGAWGSGPFHTSPALVAQLQASTALRKPLTDARMGVYGAPLTIRC